MSQLSQDSRQACSEMRFAKKWMFFFSELFLQDFWKENTKKNVTFFRVNMYRKLRRKEVVFSDKSVQESKKKGCGLRE